MKTNGGLDRQTVKEIEQFLKGEAARARDSIRSVIAERSKQEAVRFADPMILATETLQDEMQAAFVDRLNHQVSQIEAALDRLARRQYGICHECGEFIGLARLKALPFAQRCRPCQAHAEEFHTDQVMEPVAATIAEADDD